MIRVGGSDFKTVTLVDYEFAAPDGETSVPVCAVTHDLETGLTRRYWQDDLRKLSMAPYPIGDDDLVVAYYASAEVGCHLALGWDVPKCVLDLFVEFRNITNGTVVPFGAGLLGALAYFGLDAIGADEKEEMRVLANRGAGTGPWSAEERRALLNYCEGDVEGLKKLLPCMESRLDIPRVLIRGNYMVAAARIENLGVPIDTEALTLLDDNWNEIQGELIEQAEKRHGLGIFAGRTFKLASFERWVRDRGIVWPRLPSKQLATDKRTFKEMAALYPEVLPILDLRSSLSQLRARGLAIGRDGRSRCLLSAFRAVTGRNQPKGKKFIFAAPTWLRSLIKPRPGYAIIYADWCQQEYGIAAALSGDKNMQAAYYEKDFYIAFARQGRLVPADATKESHPEIRELCKQCALGVLFSMGEITLALRIGRSVAEARELLQLHRETYPTFWKWSDAAVTHALLSGQLQTAFGWTVHVNATTKESTLRNYLMQGNGSEMLRLACCAATEAGLRVLAPVHDALVIEVRIEDARAVADLVQEIMAHASATVLGGFRLKTEVKEFSFPGRFDCGKKGRPMWNSVWEAVRKLVPAERIPADLRAAGAVS